MRGSISVLHVEDDGDFADLAAGYFERLAADLSIDHVEGAEAALAAVEDGDYDCVLSDYDMPGRDGLELLDAVRAEYPDLPYVLFTGKGSEELAERALDAGATDYVSKESGEAVYHLLANRIRNAVRSRRDGSVASVERRDGQLEVLTEAMRGFDGADSAAAMAETAVGTAREVLGFDRAAVARYDADADRLEYLARSPGDAFEGDAAADRARAAYDAGEVRRFEDRAEVVYPLGEHGVVHLGSAANGGAADRVRSLAEILAGNLEAALDRAHYREELELLAERERELDLYEQAVEATTDGIAILSEDVEFLMVNSRFAESVGETKAEIVGTTVSADETEVIVEAPDNLTEQWVQTGEEAREQGRSTFFYESTVDIDRGLREIENRVTAVRQDDGSLIYVITARDITERKRREEQIEDLHASTRTLMAADSEEQVAREVVGAVESTLGFPANVVRLVDSAGESLEPVAVTDRARELLGERSTIPTEDHPLGEAFRAGEEILLDDVREHTDAFDDCAVRSVLSLPIGQYGLLSIVDDEVGAYDGADVRIAEILASNAEAAFGRVEREQALRERERALSRQIDRLDRFAGIVSHDLRNPLNVAIGHLEFMAEQVEDVEHVEAIEGALERMEAIIEDVLLLAREGDEATALDPTALEEIVRACWGTVDTADATLEVATDRRIVADKSRLRQLLENLIRNGVDHAGEDVTVRVGDVEGGFYVEDDGPGIPEADRDRVFETGYSTDDGGTGFGLSIVETIARAHGWEVGVAEGSDGGARFEFTGVEFANPPLR